MTDRQFASELLALCYDEGENDIWEPLSLARQRFPEDSEAEQRARAERVIRCLLERELVVLFSATRYEQAKLDIDVLVPSRQLEAGDIDEAIACGLVIPYIEESGSRVVFMSLTSRAVALIEHLSHKPGDWRSW
jgi:hypothetical protein